MNIVTDLSTAAAAHDVSPAAHPRRMDRPLAAARFTFEGRPFAGFAGDTITSALAAAGVMMLGRSFKYHRPRGIFSFANHDVNNMFQVDGVPNVRGDVAPLAAGMRVDAVNTFGGLARDRARFLDWLAPLPARRLLLQGVSRPESFRAGSASFARCRGLGVASPGLPRERTPKRYAFCDVLVIGAGATGTCGRARGRGRGRARAARRRECARGRQRLLDRCDIRRSRRAHRTRRAESAHRNAARDVRGGVLRGSLGGARSSRIA